jgi:hypothetical protein
MYQVGTTKHYYKEGPAAHLCLVSIVCRSYEKKPDFAGPPKLLLLNSKGTDLEM